MPPLRSAYFLAALLICSTLTAHAQSSAQRAALDSLLAGSIEQLVIPATSSSRARAMASLQRGIIEFKLAEHDDGREHLDAAQAAFDEAIFRAPDDWPWPWYGLARADIALHDAGAIVKPSMHQPAGVYYRDAAVHALGRSLIADSSFTPAAALLAERLAPADDPTLTAEVRRAIRLSVASGEAAGPAPWLVYGRMHRSLGQQDSALAAFETYLRAGGDTAVSFLEQARTLRALRDSTSAPYIYLQGAAKASTPAGRRIYRSDIEWVASPEELAKLDSLPGDSVPEWLVAFWDKRDAQSLRAPRSRLDEHLRRWLFVFRNYRVPNATPEFRGPLALPLSSPSAFGGVEGEAALINQMLSSAALGSGIAGKQFVDDRAMIYVRHGEPDRMASVPARFGGIPSTVSWQYSSPRGKYLVHFSCQSYCVLVPFPVQLEALMALDTRYQALIGPDGKSYGTALQLRRLRREIAEDLVEGLSTDGFPAEFDHQLAPEAQFYAVGAGTGHVIAVFALPGERLTGIPLDGGAMGYPVTLRLIATNASGDVVRLDTLRNFRSRQALGEGQFLFGLSHLNLPAGTWDVRLLVTQPDANAGGAIGRLGITIPEQSTLSLSDLVLGRAGSGLEWRGPNGAIHLSPLDSYNRRGDVEIYYELSGTRAETDYRTELELKALYGDAEGDLRLGFDDRATGPLLVSRRTVSLANLEPGQYRLTVTVTERASGRSATQTRLLNVAE